MATNFVFTLSVSTDDTGASADLSCSCSTLATFSSLQHCNTTYSRQSFMFATL